MVFRECLIICICWLLDVFLNLIIGIIFILLVQIVLFNVFGRGVHDFLSLLFHLSHHHIVVLLQFNFIDFFITSEYHFVHLVKFIVVDVVIQFRVVVIIRHIMIYIIVLIRLNLRVLAFIIISVIEEVLWWWVISISLINELLFLVKFFKE